VVGAAAYSSFLLAWPLDSTLDPVNSYVSELDARTQPASMFFRASDVLAGLLIVLLAVALRDGLPRHWRCAAVRRQAHRRAAARLLGLGPSRLRPNRRLAAEVRRRPSRPLTRCGLTHQGQPPSDLHLLTRRHYRLFHRRLMSLGARCRLEP
jgi:hypothetical protein